VYTYSSTYEFLYCSQARKDGYITTLFGRRRYVPDILSDDFRKRSAAERMAVNTVIQGTASDILKIAMIEVEKELSSIPGAKLIMAVHDELIFEIPKSVDRHYFYEIINKCMCDSVAKKFRLTVPLVINFEYGHNWGSMQEK
jgi:DNA polymerase I